MAVTCAHAPAKFTFKNIDQIAEPKAQPGDVLLTQEQVTTDIALLLYALDRGYAGRDFVPPSDWAKLNQKLSSLRGQTLKVSDLCDQVGDALWQVPDAHLGAQRIDSTSAKSVHCGELKRKNHRQGSVGDNSSRADKNRNWAAEFLTSGSATVAVLSIKEFPDQGDPAWAGFDTAVSKLLKNDAIIIDMRGNPGGDDRRGYQLARTLIDGEVWGGSGVSVHYRETPETLTLLKNALYLSGRQKDGSLVDFMKAAYTEVTNERDQAAAGKKAEYRVVTVPAPKLNLGANAYQGAIAILVDEDCASSCESSLFVLRQHPNAKVFGARTAGSIHFGKVGVLGLPASGILVGVATKYNEFPSGKFYDKVGFEPDVVVPSGHNAFEVATTWLREKVPNLGSVQSSVSPSGSH
jgi:hypothetical protein